MDQKKKIVYIGSFENLWDEEGNARGFENCGVEVTRIPEKDFQLNKALELIEKVKPDLVLMAKLKVGVERDSFVHVLKKMNIKTASWTFDLYFGLNREKSIGMDPIFHTDYVFGPDGGNIERFKKKGVNYHLLRQGIHDEYCYRGEFKERYAYDVVFVGHWGMGYSPRAKLCDFLKKNYHFRWFGQRNTNDIRGDKLNELYTSAKIVVGDLFYSPYYWSNRVYETLGRGGFLLFPKVEGLDKEYEPYKHYIPYKMLNLEGLKEKIDYFLNNKEKRIEISNAALEYTKNKHTLTHRANQLLKICGL